MGNWCSFQNNKIKPMKPVDSKKTSIPTLKGEAEDNDDFCDPFTIL